MLWRWLLWQQRAPLPSRLALGTVAGPVVLTGAVSAGRTAAASAASWRSRCSAPLSCSVAGVPRARRCHLRDPALLLPAAEPVPVRAALLAGRVWHRGGGLMLRNWLWLQHPEACARLAPGRCWRAWRCSACPGHCCCSCCFRARAASMAAAASRADGHHRIERHHAAGQRGRTDPLGGTGLPCDPPWRAAAQCRPLLARHGAVALRRHGPLPDAARRRTLQPPPPLSAAAAGDAVDYDIALEPSGSAGCRCSTAAGRSNRRARPRSPSTANSRRRSGRPPSAIAARRHRRRPPRY